MSHYTPTTRRQHTRETTSTALAWAIVTALSAIDTVLVASALRQLAQLLG